MKKILITSILLSYLVTSSGCGVLLYPERQGQKHGRIDPAVAILDGLGLLFYMVPGIIAFAIDFHQGTIYLPNSSNLTSHNPNNNLDTLDLSTNSFKQKELIEQLKRSQSIPLDDAMINGSINAKKLESILLEKTGEKITLDQAKLQAMNTRIQHYSAL